MTTTIYFVRHAESPFAVGKERERGLSDKGRADSQKAAELLANAGIELIVSSPYARAVDTVRPLADKLVLGIRIMEELRERPIGSLDERLSEDNLRTAIARSFTDPDHCLPYGETTRAAVERAMPSFRRLLEEHAGSKIAVGTHGNIMTILLQAFDPAFGFSFWEQTSKPDIYKLEFEGSKLLHVERLWPSTEAKKLQAIIFDLDNTLLDRDETFRRFSQKLVQTYFQEASEEQQEQWMGRIREADQDGYRPKPEMFAGLLEELPWPAKPSLEELLQFYEEHYVASAVLMDGADELLSRCRSRGLKIGMVTNGRNIIQYGKIDKLGLRARLDAIVVSEEAGCKKPDERIFRMILDRLDVAPEAALFVGDHPRNDVEGSAKTGMQAVWVKRNQIWPENLQAKPARTVTALGELHDLLI